MKPEEIFSSDPEVLGGELVFAGTRVPVKDLVDHLKGGEPLIDFTAHSFTAVTREQTVAFLGWALDAARRQATGEDAERPPAPSPERARELFRRWAEEEAAGYEGEVSWEELKRVLNEGKPADGKPFSEEG